jgi:hypothetical protein
MRWSTVGRSHNLARVRTTKSPSASNVAGVFLIMMTEGLPVGLVRYSDRTHFLDSPSAQVLP